MNESNMSTNQIWLGNNSRSALSYKQVSFYGLVELKISPNLKYREPDFRYYPGQDLVLNRSISNCEIPSQIFYLGTCFKQAPFHTGLWNANSTRLTLNVQFLRVPFSRVTLAPCISVLRNKVHHINKIILNLRLHNTKTKKSQLHYTLLRFCTLSLFLVHR